MKQKLLSLTRFMDAKLPYLYTSEGCQRFDAMNHHILEQVKNLHEISLLCDLIFNIDNGLDNKLRILK